MSYGICDIPQCEEKTFMGWRPLTVKKGFQICKPHFEMHKNDRQYLYDVFMIKRPDKSFSKETTYEACIVKLRMCPDCHEIKLKPRQRYCDNCKKFRRRKTKKEYQRKFRRNKCACA